MGLSADDFRRFRDYFYRKTGIHYDESKRYFVDKRVESRIAATASQDFSDYFARLRFQDEPAELQRLVNLLTVNETYFYREEYQFRCLVHDLLPEIAAGKPASQHIHIWSVPCSTGEEPYSIGMYLLEHWPAIRQWDVELSGSDIDSSALEHARRGVYHRHALRELSESLLRRYFEPIDADHFRIGAELRASVAFTHLNVIDAAAMARFREFDVIFCRNLLIYFDDLARRLAAEALFDALRPGGFICLGHSESMSRISPLFQIRKFPDAIVYQKP